MAISTETKGAKVADEQMNATIVVIEDEDDIRDVLDINLQAEGYKVVTCSDGIKGIGKVRETKPDLVLLDLMLPGMDGLEICKRLKDDDSTKQIPIIMVTAKGKESDVVLGLGLGADDYIPKPFYIGELIARVRAALRRKQEYGSEVDTNPIIDFDGLVLDRKRHELRVDGEVIPCTATEFRLLETLMANPSRVYSREILIDMAIGDDVTVSERTIDTHIGNVRGKLGRHRKRIRTVWGVGYRFDPGKEE